MSALALKRPIVVPLQRPADRLVRRMGYARSCGRSTSISRGTVPPAGQRDGGDSAGCDARGQFARRHRRLFIRR